MSSETRWLDRLLPWKGLTNRLQEATNLIESQSRELARLEGLLDVAGDPDANLVGDQRHELFRLTGSMGYDTRDFSAAKRLHILKLCHELYALRGTAYNIVELFVDFMVGERWTLSPVNEEDEALKKRLDEVWLDRRNRLHNKHEAYIRSAILEGELWLLCDYFPDEDGHIDLGFLPPDSITSVIQNRMGHDVYAKIPAKDPGDKDRILFIMNSFHEDIQIERLGRNAYKVTDVSTGKSKGVDGLVFAGFNARPEGAKRGRPELQQILDYIDIRDELLFSAAEREKLLSMFLLDVEDSSITSQADADKRLKELGLQEPPSRPKVIAHNERVKLNILKTGSTGAPAEGLTDSINAECYGAKGLPAHYSGQSNSTFATAKASDLVPGKRLRRKQQHWIDWWREVLYVMLTLQNRATGSVTEEISDRDFKINHMEIGGRDKARGSEILKNVVLACSQASTDGAITREAYNEAVIKALDEGGFEVSKENRGIGEDPVDAQMQIAKQQMELKAKVGGEMRPGGRGEEGTQDPKGTGPRSEQRAER